LLFYNADDHLSSAGVIILILPIIGFAMVFAQSYLDWEFKWIENLSIMQQFSQMKNKEEIVVYRIDDQSNSTKNDIPQQFYEWSGMFYAASGTQKTFGMPYSHLDTYGWGVFVKFEKKYLTERYNLRDLDPYGCEALLSIHLGSSVINKPSLDVVSKYYYLKFFKSANELGNFLSQATIMWVFPTDSPVAMNCPSHKP